MRLNRSKLIRKGDDNARRDLLVHVKDETDDIVDDMEDDGAAEWRSGGRDVYVVLLLCTSFSFRHFHRDLKPLRRWKPACVCCWINLKTKISRRGREEETNLSREFQNILFDGFPKKNKDRNDKPNPTENHSNQSLLNFIKFQV